MKYWLITIYILGVLDFLMFAESMGMDPFHYKTLIRAIAWPARTAWLVIDRLLP